jgi:hypothetical protein
MNIVRQDDTTSFPELCGTQVQQFLGVKCEDEQEERYHLFYIRLDNVWYRFFIEWEILFWETNSPDRENDLLESEEYIDILLERPSEAKRVIKEIVMRDGVLTMQFEDDTRVVIVTVDKEITAKISWIQGD